MEERDLYFLGAEHYLRDSPPLELSGSDIGPIWVYVKLAPLNGTMTKVVY